MRRRFAISFIVLAGAAGAGCGFGLADDTGKPIPGQYWRWVCADGGTAGDAGCPAADAGVVVDADDDAPTDGAPGN